MAEIVFVPSKPDFIGRLVLWKNHQSYATNATQLRKLWRNWKGRLCILGHKSSEYQDLS